MAKKANMAKRVAAETKNKKAFQEALDGKTSIIGRVEKTLGNGGFQVALGQGKVVQGLIRGVFKGGRASEAFVVAGMFVILAATTGSAKVHEIVGVINKKKDLKALKDSGCIHQSLCDAGAADDLFDYEGCEDESEMNEDEKKAYGRAVSGRAMRPSVKEVLDAMVPESPTKVKKAPVAPGAPKKVVVEPSPLESVSGIWGASDCIEPPQVNLPKTLESWEDEIDIDAI